MLELVLREQLQAAVTCAERIVNEQPEKEQPMHIIIGNIGSDAGYWVIDDTGIHHVGGWGTGELAEFSSAVNILSQATKLKAPGLAQAAVKSVQSYVETQLAQHVKGSGKDTVVVVLTQ